MTAGGGIGEYLTFCLQGRAGQRVSLCLYVGEDLSTTGKKGETDKHGGSGNHRLVIARERPRPLSSNWFLYPSIGCRREYQRDNCNGEITKRSAFAKINAASNR